MSFFTDEDKNKIKKLRREEIKNEIGLVKNIFFFCKKYGGENELKDILCDTKYKINEMFKKRNIFDF